jgi:hypothetical protein
MQKLLLTLAASLSLLVGLVALMPAAEARGGGGPGGGFGGGFAGGGPAAGGGNHGFGPAGPGGPGYGPVPGRPNPYARGAVPWINMDYNDLLQQPPNNTGSSMPNDCSYLLQKAMDSGSPEMWALFNDCSHGK